MAENQIRNFVLNDFRLKIVSIRVTDQKLRPFYQTALFSAIRRPVAIQSATAAHHMRSALDLRFDSINLIDLKLATTGFTCSLNSDGGIPTGTSRSNKTNAARQQTKIRETSKNSYITIYVDPNLYRGSNGSDTTEGLRGCYASQKIKNFRPINQDLLLEIGYGYTTRRVGAAEDDSM